ncbi:MAG TPA: sulfatase [Woeseiaceae bacterium]|nr:sulfatase [Woeseiaceae bacterium]
MARNLGLSVLLLLSVPLTGFGQHGEALAGSDKSATRLPAGSSRAEPADSAGNAVDAAARKNVILIMADDFNHWLPGVGYYPQAKTPNLDALAAKGVLFANTSAASPVCNPSRQALWSGLSPARTLIDNNPEPYIRDLPAYADVLTMNQHFLQQGYYVYGGGKLYHATNMRKDNTDNDNWSAVYEGITGSPKGSYYHWQADANDGVIEWSASTGAIANSGDTKLALHMAEKISGYSRSEHSDKPFFLAVGFFRPHLPWDAPKPFFDLYSPAGLTIPQGYLQTDLDDIPGAQPSDEHLEIVAEGKWRAAIRAYLANLSYADYNVGIVLDALEQSPYRDNTIVVFAGDHGFKLGEKHRWRKSSYYDVAHRTTMIVYEPGRTANGSTSDKAVSMLDIYPTVTALAGLPVPRHVDGRSLEPLLEAPNDPVWDFPIFMRHAGVNMVKTNEWRFVENGNASQFYDMVNDPHEFNNLYTNPQYSAELRTVQQQLLELTGTNYISVVGIPDLNGNGSPEVGVVRTSGYDRADVFIRDSVTRQPVRTLNFVESGLESVDLAVVRGVSGNADTRLAALFRRPDGQAVVQLKNAAGSGTASLRYFGKVWDATAIAGIDRSQGGPDVAVLGTRETDYQASIQLRDAGGVQPVEWIDFAADPARNHRDIAVLDDINGNGHAELASLFTLADGSARVVLRDGATRQHIRTLNFAAAQLSGGVAGAVGVTGIGDVSGNGTADVAVLWRKANGQGVVEIRDGGTGQWVREMQFFGGTWSVVAVAGLDIDGNGDAEIAVLGVRDDRTGAAVQVRDARNGQALNWIGFSNTEG